MKTEWRPDDWENSYGKQREEDGMFSQAELYEAGASAMLAARDKWWITKAFSLLDALTPTGYSTEDAFTIRKFIEQLKREVGQ